MWDDPFQTDQHIMEPACVIPPADEGHERKTEHYVLVVIERLEASNSPPNASPGGMGEGIMGNLLTMEDMI